MSTLKSIPLWFLAMLTLTGTLAMHIFAPVLPLVAQDFNANLHEVQLTLSVYIIGLAIGQLFYGPLADSIGRKPVLIVGMIVYAFASLSSIFAPNLYTLIGLRFLQALGGCSGLLLGRAIVRDTTEGNETTKKLSLMNMMVMLGPGLSPILGGLLASISGWRSIFVVLSLLGFINLLLIWKYISNKEIKREASPSMVFDNYKKLIISPKFIGYTIGGGLATTSFYAFLSVASFIVLYQLHGNLHEVSLYLALIMVGIWLGSFASNRLVDKLSIDKMIILGSFISITCSLIFFIFVSFGYLNVYTIIDPIIIYCFGVGITSPAALTKALNVNPLIAGSASGIYGFFQMVIGALCTSLSGLGHNPAFSSACVLLGSCIIAQICFKIAR
ncbi:multidrug effflux MFS transporter [Acinetobacter baumannii]